jgi:Glycolipid transfer protein (GLTP)
MRNFHLFLISSGLELIEAFFTNILNDEKTEENLRNHLKMAYKETLEPYHGFMVQQLFSVIYRWVPTRSYLIGIDERHNENMRALQTLVPPMRAHLQRLNAFYQSNNLDRQSKV